MSAVQETERPRAGSPNRRRTMIAIAALALVAVLAAGLWLALRPGTEAGSGRTELMPTPLARLGAGLPLPAGPITAQNAERLVPFARLGYGDVRRVSYSADGRWLAIATSAGVAIHDAASLAQLRFVDTPFQVGNVVISANGNLVAVTPDLGRQVWLLRLDGGPGLELEPSMGAAHLALSPDGGTLATARREGLVQLWRTADGGLINTLSDTEGDEVSQLEFSPDGRQLAARTERGVMNLWGMPGGKAGRSEEAGSFAFSADGRFLAAASGDKVTIFDERSDTDEKAVYTLQAPEGVAWFGAVAFSPDNRLLAAVEQGGAVSIWNISEQRRLSVVAAGAAVIRSIRFSDDGRSVLAATEEGRPLGWRVADGQPFLFEELRRLEDAYDNGGVTYSPAGDSLVGLDGAQLKQWRLADGKLLGRLDWPAGLITGLEFTALGETIETRLESGDIRAWSTVEGTPLSSTSMAAAPDPLDASGGFLGVDAASGTTVLWRLADPNPPPMPAKRLDWIGGAVSPDGRWLAARSPDHRAIGVWRVADGEQVYSFWAGYDLALDVAFSADSRRLAVASGLGASVWSLDDGALVRRIEAAETVQSVALSPDGTTLAAGMSTSGYAELWSLGDGRSLGRLEGHHRGVPELIWSPDGRLIATISGETATVKLWAAPDRKLLADLAAGEKLALAIAFAPDSAMLAAAGDDEAVFVWDSRSIPTPRRLEWKVGRIWSLAFTDDAAAVAAMAGDGSVRYWRAPDGADVRTSAGPWIWQAAERSPDGSVLASPGFGGDILLWSARDSSPLRALSGHTGPVNSLDFSPDGSLLASSARDATIRLWSVGDGSPLRQVQGKDGTPAVDRVLFSPDGTLLASAGATGQVRLWRVADGGEALELRRGGEVEDLLDNYTPNGMAFSPDGRLLAVTMRDGSLILWNAEDGGVLRAWRAHAGSATGVAFSPDGKLLATGGYFDQTVRVWGVK